MTESQPLRVLMVEDTPDDAELNELELRRNGFAVRSTHVDTLEGVAYALNEQVWEVVLTDHSMPSLSSLDVLQLLQERSCALPCIVVSGAIGEEAAVELMRSGAADYVNKSFLTRLGPAVKRALREEALKQDRQKAEEALRHAYNELERRVEERTAALSATNTKLRESEKRFSTAFHASPSPTLIAKLSSSQIVDVNQSFLRVTRYELKEVVGRTFEELDLFFDLQERVRKSKRLSDESLIPAVELGLRTKWGEPRRILVSSALINLEGEPCVLDTFVDITEREQANESLRTYHHLLTQQNAKLEQANNLKSEFIASVSHELRTPLTAILGFSDLLEHEQYGSLNREQKQSAAFIHESGGHLLALINDLLDISKIEAGMMELQQSVVDLPELLTNALNTVRGKAREKTLQLHVEYPSAAIAPFPADARKVRQILYNLLSNAVKYTPVQGNISVIVHDGADEVHVEISDTGPGISPNDQQRLFQPFTQLRSSSSEVYEGTGLGLALTKQLVELHGGNIWLRSEIGQGSTFGFSLPRHLLIEVPPEDRRL